MQEQADDLVSQIWDESRNRLKNFIAQKVSNQADAEDILQDVFCKIHRHIGELEDPDKLYSWVYQLTRNAIIDYYRGQKKESSVSDEFLSEIASQPAEKDIEDQVLGWLRPMIEDLPDKHREALLLTDIDGLTQKEFAEKFDLSFSGAKSRVQRARQQLREVLISCCHLEFNRSGQIVEYKQRQSKCTYCDSD